MQREKRFPVDSRAEPFSFALSTRLWTTLTQRTWSSGDHDKKYLVPNRGLDCLEKKWVLNVK